MKRLFRFHYPKITLLVLVTLISIYLFTNSEIVSKIQTLNSLAYLGIFFAGIFFAFGFSAPLAIGFFLTVTTPNIPLAILIGALGGLIGDSIIFKIIKISFMDEFLRLEKTKSIKEMHYLIKKEFSHKVRNYILYVFAGIVIASPLPDEIGVSMLAGLTHIKVKVFAIISFLMHALGIGLLLYLGLVI